MITTVVMVGESGGESSVESWVQDARRKSTHDLLDQLAAQKGVGRVVLVTPDLDGLEEAQFSNHVKSQPGSVHVGQTLSEIIEDYGVSKLLYFGGGAAPLLGNQALESVFDRVKSAGEGIVTNNRHASDWAGIAPASAVVKWKDRLPQDNMMGWVLSTEAELPIYCPQVSSSTRLDIDTPSDLLALRMHPLVKRNLRQYLGNLPLDTSSLEDALSVLAAPARQVFVTGRISPTVWAALNEATSCWIRVLSEERGMVSSGRLQRGEVFSILGDYISKMGIPEFFEMLSNQAQAAFIDTRVLLGHQRSWPSRSDRFYSDLGIASKIADPWLREFTTAALAVPIPIILGGHGLLSGNLLAFCEIL